MKYNIELTSSEANPGVWEWTVQKFPGIDQEPGVNIATGSAASLEDALLLAEEAIEADL